MTPLLQQLLQFPEVTSLVKIQQRKGAEKTKEMYYVMEKMSPTEEVWEHEEGVEERADVLYEDEVTPVGQTLVLLSEDDVLSTTEKQTQKDKKSELKGEISVIDTKRKETKVTKQRVVPKTEEVVVQQTLQDELTKEKTEEEFFVRTLKSPTEEITDERKDGTSVSPLPDNHNLSKQQTKVRVKKESETSIKTESRKIHKRAQPEETTAKKEMKLVKDIPYVEETDKTKPSPVIISTKARKQTEELEIEVKPFTEVPYKEVDYDTEIISSIPETKYSGTQEITEIRVEPGETTIKGKPTKFISTELNIVEEEIGGKDKIRIKPPVIYDSEKEETSAQDQVSVKKYEPAERKQEKKTKVDQISAEEVTVQPKESAADLKLKRTKVIEHKAELESSTAITETEETEKEEESRDVPPLRSDTQKTKKESLFIEDTVHTKPLEKKRISSQAPSRGTEKTSNIMIISISNFFPRLHFWVQSLFFFMQNHGQPAGVITSASVHSQLFMSSSHIIFSYSLCFTSSSSTSLFYYFVWMLFVNRFFFYSFSLFFHLLNVVLITL